jgi:two-component system, chemotaxis family, protein-glutamate methylesterase/glutaminase
MTRILIVDDSRFVRDQLRRILTSDPDFHIVGEAGNGKEAVDLAYTLHPDIIIMDVDMPVMDGIAATREIMATKPVPIVIHTSSAVSMRRNLPFEAIRAGALDVQYKPHLYPPEPQEQKEFLTRLHTLSRIHVFRRAPRESPPASLPVIYPAPVREPGAMPKLLAVAASTGGPKALSDMFRALPPVLPFPMLVVQHIGPAFVQGLAEWLQTFTSVRIKLASNGEPLAQNTCYLSPGSIHLAVRSPLNIHLDDSPPVNSCKPSGDVLFRSVCKICGTQSVGVVLTGIGQDGAAGLQLLHDAGAVTFAQNEESSVVFGMPRKAIELKAVSYSGDIDEISLAIQRVFRMGP